ncbi:MAG: sugar phosphorylase, partial [Thermodesulfobacteriota bacterium]|nr:sugar phosphorylase [Thermodesulfobacteriota bacterium]
ARTRLKDAFSAVHVLPFFPYSSDDGFSVIDFYRVDPDLGTWDDIAALGRDFDLMVDLVLNHISAQSPWFSRYLAKEPGFEDLAIEARPGEDLMCVVRPRTTPLLTPFTKADGTTVHVWTTFSADQVDLNYCSVSVLEKMVDVLLFYVGQGATFIRLDAVAFLWKKPGTYCIHLEQTHDMVRLFRTVLDRAAPDTVLVTETNVPHAENISYFGHGGDEAQVVYNFTLPPLLLHAFITENTAALTQWAATLELPSDRTTFLNFTASHDGIGVRPLEGILPAAEIDLLVGHTRENGGQVSFRTNPDGTQIPYELNITYLDALGRPGDDDTTRAARLLAALAVQLALPGIPAVYIHTLLGTRNWTDGAKQTGPARTINRRPLDMDDVNQAIDTPGTLRHTLFHAVVDLLRIRRRQPAFHPNAPFDVLFLSSKAFAIKRKCAGQTLFAVTNVSGSPLALLLPIETGSPPMTDLVTGKATPDGALHLKPWQTMWLAARVF